MKKVLSRIFILSMVTLLSSCSGDIKGEFSNIKTSGNDVRHTDAQLNYLNNTDPFETSPYNGNMSVSAPNPTTLSWDFSLEGATYKVNVENEYDPSDKVTYSVNENKLDIYNTLLGGHYKWDVEATYKNKKFQSEVASFVTDNNGPRNLYLEGVENVRDIGGWGYIKQGYIYRSGRFNEDKVDTVTPSITENGLFEVQNVLKFKTEIDLRRSSVNETGSLTDKSVLGDDVNYVNLPMYYGGNNILTYTGKANHDNSDTYIYDNPKMIKEFFEILSHEENYPIVFHCSIGKDRTGCLAYLLEALMGFDLDTIHRDYMFTNFSDAGMCKKTDIVDKYEKTISDYEGDTLEQKTFNYLTQVVGIEHETLERIAGFIRL